jgi:ketosteroid isomerase-like protein
MILDDFFAAAEAFDADALAAVLHPDARISELPNALNRGGTERNRDAAREAFARGRALLAAQTYEVHEVLEDGERIAARATWRGTMAIDAGPLRAGQELTAHIATFTQVRDGRIYRHATYDCYEPLA